MIFLILHFFLLNTINWLTIYLIIDNENKNLIIIAIKQKKIKILKFFYTYKQILFFYYLKLLEYEKEITINNCLCK